MEKSVKKINAGSVLKVTMAKNGGWVAVIRQK